MSMLLKKLLNKATDSDRSLTTKLAAIAGCKVPALHKFIHEPTREFDNFEGLLNIVKHLYPEREYEIMVDYAEHVDANKKTARVMLEYLACSRQLVALVNLIDRLINSTNKESVLWGKTYRLLYDWLKTDTVENIDAFLKEIKDLNVSNITHLDMMKNLLTSYVYIYKGYYKQVSEMSEEISYSLESLEKGYLEKVYRIRLYEVLSVLNLNTLNKPEVSRKYAMDILDISLSKSFNAYAHWIVGKSYFFDSYEESSYHLSKSIELYQQLGRHISGEDVGFFLERLNIYWDKGIPLSNSKHESNRLYSNLKTGKDVTSSDLNELDMEIPFNVFLKGLYENSTEVLFQSMVMFLKAADVFNSYLPKLELQKRGFSEFMLEQLVGIHS